MMKKILISLFVLLSSFEAYSQFDNEFAFQFIQTGKNPIQLAFNKIITTNTDYKISRFYDLENSNQLIDQWIITGIQTNQIVTDSIVIQSFFSVSDSLVIYKSKDSVWCKQFNLITGSVSNFFKQIDMENPELKLQQEGINQPCQSLKSAKSNYLILNELNKISFYTGGFENQNILVKYDSTILDKEGKWYVTLIPKVKDTIELTIWNQNCTELIHSEKFIVIDKNDIKDFINPYFHQYISCDALNRNDVNHLLRGEENLFRLIVNHYVFENFSYKFENGDLIINEFGDIILKPGDESKSKLTILYNGNNYAQYEFNVY